MPGKKCGARGLTTATGTIAAQEHPAGLTQQLDIFDHTFSFLRIGHPPKSRAEIVGHVLRFVGSWDDRGNGGMARE